MYPKVGAYRSTLCVRLLIDDIVMARGEQKWQNRMTSDIVHPESVTGCPALMPDTQNLAKFALISKGNLPQVESTIVVFCH